MDFTQFVTVNLPSGFEPLSTFVMFFTWVYNHLLIIYGVAVDPWNLVNYLYVVFTDGDWLNDWLTHFDMGWDATVSLMRKGVYIARVLGFEVNNGVDAIFGPDVLRNGGNH